MRIVTERKRLQESRPFFVWLFTKELNTYVDLAQFVYHANYTRNTTRQGFRGKIKIRCSELSSIIIFVLTGRLAAANLIKRRI